MYILEEFLLIFGFLLVLSNIKIFHFSNVAGHNFQCTPIYQLSNICEKS